MVGKGGKKNSMLRKGGVEVAKGQQNGTRKGNCNSPRKRKTIGVTHKNAKNKRKGRHKNMWIFKVHDRGKWESERWVIGKPEKGRGREKEKGGEMFHDQLNQKERDSKSGGAGRSPNYQAKTSK